MIILDDRIDKKPKKKVKFMKDLYDLTVALLGSLMIIGTSLFMVLLAYGVPTAIVVGVAVWMYRFMMGV